MNADISVIIPCYNAEKFIKDTIESILNQTVKCKEIIVVNDGSTDKTLDALSNYKKYIKIISIPNSGVSVARNMGIKNSTGKFLAFCDADDLWHEKKIERQLEFIKSNKVNFLCTSAYLIGKNAENFKPLHPPKNPIPFDNLLFCNYIYTSSVILERKILDEIGLFWDKLRNLQDWHLWLRIALKYDIYFLEEKLIYYRLHSEGISKNFLKSLDYATLLFDDIFNKTNKDQNLKKRAISSFFMNYGTIAHYYGDYNSSLKIFLKSLKIDPFILTSYKYLLLSIIKKILNK